MPIQKYKTFEDADKALFCFNPDDVYFMRLEQFYQTATYLVPNHGIRGIFKYKTIEDLNKNNPDSNISH